MKAKSDVYDGDKMAKSLEPKPQWQDTVTKKLNECFERMNDLRTKSMSLIFVTPYGVKK